MSFLGRKRRAGVTTLLAADSEPDAVRRVPWGWCCSGGIDHGVLAYEWLRHRNNEL